jgi:hypothetical protein
VDVEKEGMRILERGFVSTENSAGAERIRHATAAAERKVDKRDGRGGRAPDEFGRRRGNGDPGAYRGDVRNRESRSPMAVIRERLGGDVAHAEAAAPSTHRWVWDVSPKGAIDR